MTARKSNSLKAMGIAVAVVMGMIANPAAAQVKAVDPDTAIDGDLMPRSAPVSPAPAVPTPTNTATMPNYESASPAYVVDPSASAVPATSDGRTTYQQDDLIGAAEGVFGKGARGLADMIEDVLKKQGEPNGYIVGREGGGALVLGVRYGSGTLHHKVEGEKPVYWTGPSIGFDGGANAGSAFVLVYNLYDSQDLYKRFPAGEGQAYLVGGFNVSYMRRGDVVLIPVRMGAGLRLGANVGYMKFSERQRWLPF
jgi:hypothetical protein